MIKNKTIVYVGGAFDLFHIGHLNILRAAKQMCDILIVGVTTDELVIKYKKKKAVISFKDRIEIIRSIKYVDIAIPQNNMSKVKAVKKLKFNVLIVGDDWYDSEKWNKEELELNKYGVKVIYFPYTSEISSTRVKKRLKSDNKKNI